MIASVDEMIDIARASGARVHISHMKAAGTDMWGHAVEELLSHIRRAQREGIDIGFDAYPYTAGSTTLLSLFPPGNAGRWNGGRFEANFQSRRGGRISSRRFHRRAMAGITSFKRWGGAG